jgi:hypothetical protein
MPDVTCAFCGKILQRRPSQISESKSGLFFCNSKEKAQYWLREGLSKREQLGKHHYSHIGVQLRLTS